MPCEESTFCLQQQKFSGSLRFRLSPQYPAKPVRIIVPFRREGAVTQWPVSSVNRSRRDSATRDY